MQLSLDALAFDQMKQLMHYQYPVPFEIWNATFIRLNDRMFKKGCYLRPEYYGLLSPN